MLHLSTSIIQKRARLWNVVRVVKAVYIHEYKDLLVMYDFQKQFSLYFRLNILIRCINTARVSCVLQELTIQLVIEVNCT